ncbi:hypothetical protein NJD71_04255 [Psychrobacter sp. PP-21]|uniref:hypothetical protein n=1 Tax=Psychrobacter sp. PP-21 TaxID=2957503 RepID=UPI0029BB9288|nr:hypothetical protein [Psychrobacter sp. PP-21]MDX2373339.1 hypothetical protein [Psychrobacter sp. PP-21]
MLRFLSVKPNTDTHYQSTLLAAAFTSVLFLTGCQQQADTQPVSDDTQTSEKTSVEDSQPMPQSDSAAARIEQFQPIYVAQAQGLQRRLQAEYESLQAADASDSDESLLGGAADNANDNVTDSIGENTTSKNSNNEPLGSASEGADVNSAEQTVASNSSMGSNADSDAAVDINTSTEVGERDLTVLKRISLEPRKPVILTEAQIIERYQQTMDTLYQPVTTPLSAEDSDTLINIATLVPQLFEHAEIAGRVSAKSPALARLIIQHQVWEQIEAQQVVDMQQMKQQQQQEFEMLMTKFNDTIKGYDEQIAKYEQTLKEFQ